MTQVQVSRVGPSHSDLPPLAGKGVAVSNAQSPTLPRKRGRVGVRA
jgi:hypothetical protein